MTRSKRTPDQIERAVAGRIGCTVDELRAHEDRREAWCTSCRRWLDEVEHFHAHSGRSTGRSVWCRECKAAIVRANNRGDRRLTDDLVRELRDLYWWGASSERLAAHYAIDRRWVLLAICGVTCIHVSARRVPLRDSDLAWLRGEAERGGEMAA